MVGFLLQRVKSLWIIIGPILFSPLLFIGGPELRCVFCIFVLSSFWLCECAPIGVTSLLPIFLLPATSLLKADDVASLYMKDTTVILMITLFMALAVEECGLHKRTALFLLKQVGTSDITLLAGFTLITAFISFFVSDSATTALMIPIAIAILNAREKAASGDDSIKTVPSKVEETRIDLKGLTKQQRGLSKALILICSHASLIGGTAILTSTGPNLIFRAEINKYFPNGEVRMSYLDWLSFSLVPMFLYLIASFFVVTTYFIGPTTLITMCYRSTDEEKKSAEKIRKSISKSYEELGPITFAELSVIFWFSVLILAWVLREPGFMPGWVDWFHLNKSLWADSCVGVLIVFIIFAWPKHGIPKWRRNIVIGRPELSISLKPEPVEKLITWSTVQQRMSWSVVLLIGAGFTLSKAVQVSGLSKSVACLALSFQHMPPVVIQIAVTTVITFLTEFASNTATAAVFVPIVIDIAISLGLHPLYLGIPSAIAPSFAFMFPMATPPNAVVYDTKAVSFMDMAVTGFALNCLCICITVITMNTWTSWVLDLGTVPILVQAMNSTSLNCTV